MRWVRQCQRGCYAVIQQGECTSTETIGDDAPVTTVRPTFWYAEYYSDGSRYSVGGMWFHTLADAKRYHREWGYLTGTGRWKEEA